MSRLAKLYRRRAEIQAELAEVDAQIADELSRDGEGAELPKAPRRRRRGPLPPRPNSDTPPSDLARARARRILSER